MAGNRKLNSYNSPHTEDAATAHPNSLSVADSLDGPASGKHYVKNSESDNSKGNNRIGWNSVCVTFRQLLDRILKLRHPDVVKIGIDAILIAIAAGWTWFVSYSQVSHPGSPIPFILAVVLARLLIYLPLRLQRHSWIHVSRYELLSLSISALLGPFVIAGIFLVLPEPFTLRDLVRPHMIVATEPALYMLLLCMARLTARTLYSGNYQNDAARRLLIVGAGSAGRALAFQIQETDKDYNIVGFVDDDPRLQCRRIRGVPVLGRCQDLAKVATSKHVDEVVIAITTLKPERLREIVAYCSQTGLPVRILPPLHELLGQKAGLRSLREVSMEDLLPRPEVKLDRNVLSKYLGGKTVMVTGGGGSIGGELCRQVLAAGARRVVVLGRGENSVFEIVQELNEICERKSFNVQANGNNENAAFIANGSPAPCEIIPVICDVRDRQGLKRAFDAFSPQVVFHAAAHKHVPLMEQYPCEAVKNNVVGTLNVVQLAIECSVERFVMVSTDKAVAPANVMGATKRIGEMIVKAYAATHNRNMVCVRFGNVLGSRGSVVPTMTRQIKKGLPVTVTDPEMVRYFMTIPEAVQLILQAGSVGGCGEVFVLDMGRPVRILDLAHDLIRLSGLVPEQDIPVRIIGKRPGEKMSEELLTSYEHQSAEKRGPFFVAPRQDVSISTLLSHIGELAQTGERGDEEEVVNIIQKIIPDAHTNLKKAKLMTSAPAITTPGKEFPEVADADVVRGMEMDKHDPIVAVAG